MINIAELREKIARATPLPWRRGTLDEFIDDAIVAKYCGKDITIMSYNPNFDGEYDLELVVAAVNNIAALCDEVERLRAENKTQRKYIRDLEIELRDLQRRVRQLYGALEGARRIASEYYAFGLTGFEGDYAQIVNQLKDEPDWEDK